LNTLKLQKTKNYKNFLTDKLSKRSESYQDDVKRTLRRLDEYTILKHDRTRDDIVDYLRAMTSIEEREEETIGWIQGFMDSLAEGGKISFKVLQVYLSHVKKYLKYYKVRIDFGDEIELPAALLEERYAIPIEDIRTIIENAPWKYKGYFLSLVSSGARPIEIMALRKKDFVWMNTRWKAIIPAKYTKKKISRTVFFSLEVTPYINQLFKTLGEEDRVWTKNGDMSDTKLKAGRQNAGVMFRKICNKIGFTERYETTNFFKYNMYCFRSHFFTKALRSLTEDKDTAHAMIGHGAYLQTYQRRTDEEKLELFNEVETAILVFDQTKNKEKILKLKEANVKLEEKVNTINELQIDVAQLKAQKKGILKRSNMTTISESELTEQVRKVLKEEQSKITLK